MLQLDKSTELKNKIRSRFCLPKITLSIKGIFRINRYGLKLMNLQKGDYVQFVYDTVNHIQYISKDLNKTTGFKIRCDKSKAGLFNCTKLTYKITDRLDLALSESRKKRVTLDIESESHRNYNGSPIYKIY